MKWDVLIVLVPEAICLVNLLSRQHNTNFVDMYSGVVLRICKYTIHYSGALRTGSSCFARAA